MISNLIKLQNNLEIIKKAEKGFEYWSARELMPILGYKKWQTFLEAIKRAMDSCKNSGQKKEDHFTGVGKMVVLGSGSQRKIDDFLLTRYACYLIAQNGDPRKPEEDIKKIELRRRKIHQLKEKMKKFK